MHRNRIQRFTAADFAYAAAFAQLPAAHQQAAQTFGSSQGAGTMVFLPSVVQAPWQAQVYRLAYEKASGGHSAAAALRPLLLGLELTLGVLRAIDSTHGRRGAAFSARLKVSVLAEVVP